jgi:hypothetical protein
MLAFMEHLVYDDLKAKNSYCRERENCHCRVHKSSRIYLDCLWWNQWTY